MARYLLLKHYRGAPAAVNDVPMAQWTPVEVSAHMQYMQDFAARLEGTGEFVDGQALSPEGTFVRYDGEGRPPVTDGPFAETKDLIAGWMVIDVETYERAVGLAGELSAAPGAGGKPIHEWLEGAPVLGRGCRAGRPGRGRARVAARPTAGSQGLAGHRGVAQVPRCRPRRYLPTASRGTHRRRAHARPGRSRGRHAPAVLPVCAPVPDTGLGSRTHVARGRRPDDASDRAGLPRSGGDHGPADQQGQANRLGSPVHPAR
ncbi:hypothetical protein BH23ACT9_BH23ACT9_25430 [soil metagenome]